MYLCSSDYLKPIQRDYHKPHRKYHWYHPVYNKYPGEHHKSHGGGDDISRLHGNLLLHRKYLHNQLPSQSDHHVCLWMVMLHWVWRPWPRTQSSEHQTEPDCRQGETVRHPEEADLCPRPPPLLHLHWLHRGYHHVPVVPCDCGHWLPTKTQEIIVWMPQCDNVTDLFPIKIQIKGVVFEAIGAVMSLWNFLIQYNVVNWELPFQRLKKKPFVK